MLRLFRLAGIPIQADAGWLIVLTLVTWTLAGGYLPRVVPGASPAAYWVVGLLAAVLLFLSVLVHELSHAAAALAFGLRVREVRLHLFGGVSHLESEPSTPRAESWIAAVGPLTSFSVAAASFWLRGSIPGAPWIQALLGYLAAANVLLGAFNLVPGFPLDGGRILRAGLWAWQGEWDRATRVASRIGTGFALVLAAVGLARAFGGDLVGGAWFVLIGLFLLHGAQSSYDLAVVKSRLEAITVLEVLAATRGFDPALAAVPLDGERGASVAASDTAWTALLAMSRASVGRLCVTEMGRLIGEVTRRDIERALHRSSAAGRVSRHAA